MIIYDDDVTLQGQAELTQLKYPHDTLCSIKNFFSTDPEKQKKVQEMLLSEIEKELKLATKENRLPKPLRLSFIGHSGENSFMKLSPSEFAEKLSTLLPLSMKKNFIIMDLLGCETGLSKTVKGTLQKPYAAKLSQQLVARDLSIRVQSISNLLKKRFQSAMSMRINMRREGDRIHHRVIVTKTNLDSHVLTIAGGSIFFINQELQKINQAFKEFKATLESKNPLFTSIENFQKEFKTLLSNRITKIRKEGEKNAMVLVDTEDIRHTLDSGISYHFSPDAIKTMENLHTITKNAYTELAKLGLFQAEEKKSTLPAFKEEKMAAIEPPLTEIKDLGVYGSSLKKKIDDNTALLDPDTVNNSVAILKIISDMHQLLKTRYTSGEGAYIKDDIKELSEVLETTKNKEGPLQAKQFNEKNYRDLNRESMYILSQLEKQLQLLEKYLNTKLEPPGPKARMSS